MTLRLTGAALVTLIGGAVILATTSSGIATTLGLALAIPGVALTTVTVVSARREHVIDLRDHSGTGPAPGPEGTAPADDAVSPGRARPARR